MPPNIEVTRISPKSIRIRLEQIAKKDVNVIPEIIGTPPAGYRLKSIEINPQIVAVEGAEGVVNRLSAIKTEPINLSAIEKKETGLDVKLKLNGRGGKDTRLSGYMLESALTSGICSIGVDVLLIGPLPTPGIAFITRALRADAGVVISASHNPYEDNGIKFFSEDGFKLPDDLELEIEKLIFSGKIASIRPTAKDMGKAYRINDAEGRYIEFAKNSIPKGMDFEGMKIVLDCANGAAYKVAPMMLRELGAEVAAIGIEPSGMNINDGCGSLYPKKLQELV